MRTKTWIFIGLRKELFIYSQKQKEKALPLYHQTKSVTRTIRILGYPIRRNLYTWISAAGNPLKTRKEYLVIDNRLEHLGNLPL